MTPRRTIFAGLLAIFVLVVAAGAAGMPASPTEAGQGGASRHLVMMVVYATLALVFSFLCSVAEAVVLSVSPSYIANLENEGRRSAGLLKRIKADIDRSLAGILTLNTIAHTVGAGGAGAEAAAYFGDQYVGIAMAVLTLLILFLSEIIPKTLGAVYWRRLAPATARFVQWLTWLLYPLIAVSELITKWLSRGQALERISREEFEAMADVGAETGNLDPKESRILKNLFRMPILRAEDVMTPRTVMFSLQQDLIVAEVLESHGDLGFSRIPVYGENHDDVTGFVLKSDVLLNQYRNQGKAKLRDLKRELRAVEDDTPLDQVFEELLDYRAHLLLVVDHYGGTQGLVTLEDVVETLIGIEIVDEGDKIDDMRRLARQKWEERMRRLGIDVREPEPEEPGKEGHQ